LAYVSGQRRDKTDRRKADALQRQEAAVKERMQAVLDASPLLCIIADEDGNLVDVNKEAEQSAGSTQIMPAIAQVNDITGQVKEDARQMV